MKQPHDTQIGWPVLKRNLHRVTTITADNGNDWDEFHQYLREAGARPVIKHREFTSLDAAHNARIDDDTSHRRSVIESAIASLRRRFDDTIRARTWSGQFRELVLKAAEKYRSRHQALKPLKSSLLTHPNRHIVSKPRTCTAAGS